MTKHADQAITQFVADHIDTIRNALYVHSQRMEEAAKEASTAHQAGQKFPEIREVQDRSIMTNAGYGHAAQEFTQEAKKAAEVARALDGLLAGRFDDDTED